MEEADQKYESNRGLCRGEGIGMPKDSIVKGIKFVHLGLSLVPAEQEQHWLGGDVG